MGESATSGQVYFTVTYNAQSTENANLAIVQKKVKEKGGQAEPCSTLQRVHVHRVPLLRGPVV